MTSKAPGLSEIRKVAVFRALRLGDMLCAVPALRGIRRALPRARITLVGLPWATQFARRFRHLVDDFAAFPGHPDLPEQDGAAMEFDTFCHDLRGRRFDLAIQLHGDGRVSNAVVAAFGARRCAGFHVPGQEPPPGLFLPYPDRGHESVRLARLAEFLGARPESLDLEFPLVEEDFAELHRSGVAADLWTDGRCGDYVCMHPGASRIDKCWRPEAFAAVADALAEEHGVRIVLTGSPQETAIVAEVVQHMKHRPVDAAAPISVGAMAALMDGGRLLVCNDTGVSHLAVGLKLPSVVIFSRSDMERWAPPDRHLHACLWNPSTAALPRVLDEARRRLRPAPVLG